MQIWSGQSVILFMFTNHEAHLEEGEIFFHNSYLVAKSDATMSGMLLLNGLFLSACIILEKGKDTSNTMPSCFHSTKNCENMWKHMRTVRICESSKNSENMWV